MVEPTRSSVYHLTPRERSIVIAFAKTAGTDKQVAAMIGIAVGTMKVQLSRVRAKLTAQGYDVGSRYSLITWSKEHASELEVE